MKTTEASQKKQAKRLKAVTTFRHQSFHRFSPQFHAQQQIDDDEDKDVKHS
jgi:hypothetical protein